MDVTREELAARLGEASLTLLDVRTPEEYAGRAGYPCDPRQGHIAGARNVPLGDLLGPTPEQIRELLGLPNGAEIICYCHSGTRSVMAVEVLRGAGYEARNYAGSWHEWARDPNLPAG